MHAGTIRFVMRARERPRSAPDVHPGFTRLQARGRDQALTKTTLAAQREQPRQGVAGNCLADYG